MIRKNDSQDDLPQTEQKTVHQNGAASWIGRLDLTLQQSEGQRTVLTDRTQCGPLTIQRPFYPEGSPCHLYLLHPPGGLVGGDILALTVNLQQDAHLVMTMPGATKFYRSQGKTAQLTQTFHVGKNAVLEWLPQDNILFAGAKAQIKTEIIFHPSSRLIGFESLSLGRQAMGEQFRHGELSSDLLLTPETVLDNNASFPKFGVQESLKIVNRHHSHNPQKNNLQENNQHETDRQEDDEIDPLGGYAYSATFFAYPANEALLTIARDHLQACPFPAGATLLDGILLVRLLTFDNLLCEHYLHTLWATLRPILLDRPPCPPRIWAT